MPGRSAVVAGLPRLALFAPFLTAVVAHAVGSRPAPVAAGPTRPALAFDQYLVDLGTTPASDQVLAKYRFRNTSPHTVTIHEPQASCGCMKPTLTTEKLKPGEAAEMFVRVRTASVEPGRKEYTLTLPYTDTQRHEATLAFRVTLPPKQVLVRPRALHLFQLSGRPTEQIIEVIDQRPTMLSITEVRSNTPWATVERLEPSINEDGRSILRVKVTVAGQVPPGRLEGAVHIQTSDPLYKQLTVPLRIDGRRTAEAQRDSTAIR